MAAANHCLSQGHALFLGVGTLVEDAAWLVGPESLTEMPGRNNWPGECSSLTAVLPLPDHEAMSSLALMSIVIRL